MNEMQVFRNPEFGSIRTIEGDGKVLFCASDVAKALGYARPKWKKFWQNTDTAFLSAV